MQYRIAGVLVVAAALYFGFFFARAFVDSAAHVNTFVEISDALGEPIPDPANFLLHWRVTYGLLTVVAALGLAAGVAMFFLKRWSLLVIAAIAGVCAVLGIVGSVSGYLHYGFERSGVLSHLALVLLAAAAVYSYRRWPREQIHATNA
jgi:tetrahydromethanopterin S-methyltransferase subunit E